MNQSLKIDPYGFREYDARWVYQKDINSQGITNLGKGLGTQIIKHTKKWPQQKTHLGMAKLPRISLKY